MGAGALRWSETVGSDNEVLRTLGERMELSAAARCTFGKFGAECCEREGRRVENVMVPRRVGKRSLRCCWRCCG